MTEPDLRASCKRETPRSRLRWVYPIALATMVVVASGRGQVAAPAIVNIDKIVHFSVFGLLATLVVRAPGVRPAWVAVAVASAFGVSDEIRQSFTPGRSVELADWMADTSGACLAVGLYTFWVWYRRLLETPLRWPRRRAPAPRAAAPVAENTPATAA